MRMRAKFLTALFLTVTLSHAEETPPEETGALVTEEAGVLVLTDHNFDQAVSQHALVLVEFYAPWCGHCQELTPKFEAAARMLADSGAAVRLAKVDATQETALSERFSVEGFPTLKLVRPGGSVPVEYSGERETQALVSWLVSKTGPQWQLVGTKDQLEDRLQENKAIAVGFFSDTEGEEAAVFKDVAAEVDGVNFYIVSDPKVMAEYSQSDESILVLKTFDDTKLHFTDILTKEGLKKFVEKSSRPLVTEFSQENASQIFDSGIEKHFLLLSGKADQEYSARLDIVSRQCCNILSLTSSS